MASLTEEQKNELGMLASLGAAMVEAVFQDSPTAMVKCSMQAARLAMAPGIEDVLNRVEALLTEWNGGTSGHPHLNSMDQ